MYDLESMVVRTIIAVAGSLLVLGSVLTVYADPDEHVPNWRLLTVPFEIFGALGALGEAGGDDVGIGVAMGVGYLGLLLCVVVAVGICFVQWGRQAGPVTERVAKLVASLMLIGMWVPVIFTGLAANSDNASVSAGPAMWMFVPGAVIFAVMAFTPYARRLWRRGE